MLTKGRLQFHDSLSLLLSLGSEGNHSKDFTFTNTLIFHNDLQGKDTPENPFSSWKRGTQTSKNLPEISA